MEGNYGDTSGGASGGQPSAPPTYPPPQPPTFQSPYIGESSKIRSVLDILNITKILALVVGILGFIVAIWDSLSYAFWFGWIPALTGAIYGVLTGVINLLIYMRIPEYEAMIRSRRYSEAKSDMLIWGVLGLIFGFIAGILLLIVIFVYLEELERMYTYPQPPQTRYPPPPPQP